MPGQRLVYCILDTTHGTFLGGMMTEKAAAMQLWREALVAYPLSSITIEEYEVGPELKLQWRASYTEAAPLLTFSEQDKKILSVREEKRFSHCKEVSSYR